MCSQPQCLTQTSPFKMILEIKMKLLIDSFRISEPYFFFKARPMKGNGKIPFQYQYMSPKRTIRQKKYYVGELTILLVKLKPA